MSKRTYIARIRVFSAYIDPDLDENNLRKIRDTDISWDIGADGSGMSGMEAELLDWRLEAEDES